MTTAQVKTASSSSVIGRVRTLLDKNCSEEALDLVHRQGGDTPEAKNAQAVCLLRLGRFEGAAAILRDIAFRGFACMPDDTPLRFQLNFATAMLMANHKDAAFTVMDRLRDEMDPQAVQLRQAIERWKEQIGLIGRIRARFGFYPGGPVKLDFPLGQV